jgi:hypothetical protein
VVEPPSDTGTAVTGRRADLLAVVEAYDAYHPVPPSDLDERVARLAPRVEEMTPDEFLVAVSRLTAGRDRDGHTGVFPLAQPDLEVWPLQLYAFDDGWRVIRARPPYRHLVGARVTAVGGRSMDEVTRMVAPLVSRDNSATVRGRLPQYLVVPSLLRGLGLRPSLTVGGQQVVPEPISTESYAAWNGLFYPLVCPRLRPPSSPDWTITRSDRGIVARYGLVSRFDGDRTIDAFAARLRRLSRSTEGPIVIDVRDNPGGDNGTYPRCSAPCRTSRTVDRAACAWSSGGARSRLPRTSSRSCSPPPTPSRSASPWAERPTCGVTPPRWRSPTPASPCTSRRSSGSSVDPTSGR